MAANNRSISRIATRFNRLLVKLSAFKKDSPDQGDYLGAPMLVVQVPPGQTANAIEVRDSTGAVVYSVDATGHVTAAA